jgi:putative DNA methylase
LNVFSRSYPILDSSGESVRPEVAFAEARKAIANYRFRKLVQTDTAGFDPLTQWYLLAWDAFKAREFPFDEARQLALAVGGFDVNDLVKVYKLLAAKSGSCTILTPKQRHKKRAFAVDVHFNPAYLIDGLHAIMAIYEEEQNPQLVRNFLKNTGLISNEMLMKTIEIAFKVIPKNTNEHNTLTSLWLSMDEIKAKVVYEQTRLSL